MIAFMYCARNHPDKTEILWAESATVALGQACRNLHISALHMELERVPELDGQTACPEGMLDNYRVQMMDRFPTQVVATIPDEDSYEWKPDPVVRYTPKEASSGLDDGWGEDVELPPVGGNRPVKRPQKTPNPKGLKGLKTDSPVQGRHGNKTDKDPPPKKKAKPRDSYRDGDRDEWGRK